MSTIILSAFVPVCFIAIIFFFFRRLALASSRREIYAMQKKRSIVVKSILASYKLLTLLLAVLYCRYAYSLFLPYLANLSFLSPIFSEYYFFIVLLMISLLILQIVTRFKEIMIRKLVLEEKVTTDLDNNPKRTKIDALAKLLCGLWVVFAGILTLQHIGVPVSSILAFGGMGSIVLGFAAKDLLGDFISGFLIYIDGGFDLGEWIKLEEPKLEGTVEYIGWRVSRIRTFDDRPLYVPNGLLSKAIVQNVSRRESMRIKEYITVSVDSANKMATICKEIRNDVLTNHDGIDQSRSIVVNLTSYQAGVCWIYVSAFTRSGDMQGFYGIKQDILIKINAILQANNVEIESPKVSVNQIT